MRAKTSPLEVDKPRSRTCCSGIRTPCSLRCRWACEETSANGLNYTAANIESIVEQINTSYPVLLALLTTIIKKVDQKYPTDRMLWARISPPVPLPAPAPVPHYGSRRTLAGWC